MVFPSMENDIEWQGQRNLLSCASSHSLHPWWVHTPEVGEEGARGDAGLDEPAGAERLRPDELQDALADEDQADVEADEDDRTRRPGGGQLAK